MNVLADALSRLTKHIRLEATEMRTEKPRILGLSSCRARRARELQAEHPLVQNLAAVGSLDPEYIQLMNLIERRGNSKDLPPDCKLKQVEGSLKNSGWCR